MIHAWDKENKRREPLKFLGHYMPYGITRRRSERNGEEFERNNDWRLSKSKEGNGHQLSEPKAHYWDKIKNAYYNLIVTSQRQTSWKQQKKKELVYKEALYNMADFSVETFQNRREWNDEFRIPIRTYSLAKILCPVKWPFKDRNIFPYK